MFIETGTIPSDKFSTASVTINASDGKRKKNVLILTQHQVVEDKGEKHYPPNVLWNTQTSCLVNIVKHINDYEKQKLPQTIYVVDVPDDVLDEYTITNINKFIKRNDIDIVLCAGFSTAANFTKYTPWRCSQLRGRILRSRKLDVPFIPTFPTRQVMSEDKRDWKSHINLLGFFKEDLTTALRGKNLYTINTDIKYTGIDTMRKWKKFYKKLRKSKYCAIDTEGKNLNRRFGNELYIIQFSIKPDFAYILPYKHRLTPFSKKELRIIRQDLQEYFETADHATLLTQNGKFDFTIFMSLLGVRFLAPKIYDMSVGEYCLEENRKYMWNLRVYDSPVGLKIPSSLKTISGYSLETFVAQYSGRFPYDDSTIGKADRIYLNNYTFEEYAPYCARDVIYLWRIMECQIAEAKRRGGFYNKFLVSVTELGAAMLHIFVEMEYNGVLIDRDYLKKTVLPNSIAAQQVTELKKKLYEFPNVIKANNRMLKEEKHQGITIPLFSKKPWVFNIDVQHDQQVLFIDVLKIPILKYRKNGDASIDAKFIENFKVYPEVETLDSIRELKTLFNTHLKGNLKILQTSPDCRDSRLRSNYDFLGVVTFRTSSSEPALQQIPQHTENAKIIKAAFIADFLGILLDVDYNAHEVRIWGNLSRDKVMAKAFVIGMRIRRQIRIWQAEDFDRATAAYAYLEKIEWFREKDDKITGKKALLMPEREKIARKLPKDVQQLAYLLIELKKKGDVHNNNYSFFFNIPAEEVTKPQRQSVKETIFGSMYGKTGETLGEDLNKEEVRSIKLANLEKTRYELHDLLHPYHEMGRNLIDKMFDTFKKGHAWIIDRQNEAQTFMRTASPIGPVRHIWGYFFAHKSLLNRMDRLASNSINQGLASNLGYIGARQFQIIKFMALKKGINFHTKIVNSVHDSLKNEVTNIVNLAFVLYYLEHSLMTQTAKVSKEVYGFPLYIGLEAEFELGPNGSNMTKYGFTEYSFFQIIHKCIDAQEKKFNRVIKGKKYLLQYLRESYRYVETHRAKELAKVESFEPETRILLTLEKVKAFQEGSRAYHKFIQYKQ